VHAEHVCEVLRLDPVENGLNVRVGIRDLFSTHDSLEYFVNLCLVGIVDDTWTINQINALGQRDVLPNLRLSWNRCDFADTLLHECIDDRRFADIRVANKADTDAFLLPVQVVELLEQLNQ